MAWLHVWALRRWSCSEGPGHPVCSQASRKSAGIHIPPRVAERAKPDRPYPHRGAGADAGSLADAGGRGFSGDRHPTSDGSHRHGTTALHVYRPASGRGNRAARRSHQHSHPVCGTRLRIDVMSATFITATGTDIGKTFVAVGLIRHLRSQGRPVGALKPIVSGFDPSVPAGSDPAALLKALGRPATIEELALTSPWQFRAPLSPDMAARAEGRRLNVETVISFCRDAIAAAEGTLLIEGVGGIMVPLDDRHTVLDWMAELRLPLVLVAGSYLGTISHTLSALDVLARRNLTVRALVVNETIGSPVPIRETLATLANFATGIPLLALPRLPSATVVHPVFEKLTELVNV